jgi:hypothetical protein
MNLQNRIERLEQEAHTNGKELCRHLPPIIHWPDGRIENESAHVCGLPRLVFIVRYSDGSDEAGRRAPLKAFDNIRARLPEIPAAKVAEIVANEFELTPEKSRPLLEHAGVGQ